MDLQILAEVICRVEYLARIFYYSKGFRTKVAKIVDESPERDILGHLTRILSTISVSYLIKPFSAALDFVISNDQAKASSLIVIIR